MVAKFWSDLTAQPFTVAPDSVSREIGDTGILTLISDIAIGTGAIMRSQTAQNVEIAKRAKPQRHTQICCFRVQREAAVEAAEF